ncbi:cytochrome c oxidase subunit 5B, mitochondrial isoform X1 [Nilaparvata lugens]|uniref:cytochrome c oxidase subunit 5B, mitochondrial isoform X1 n=1 Tax=Nilaparvata lugens TaxID=108931 RepID=UPI00193D93C8|nr:cytochrome c oxidase subunit 5B, mitochondrial isoform X1 [Nilaparvata lugens]
MASFLVRNALNITRRGLFTSSVRSAIPEEFPDTMKVITGLEKKEIEANMAGKDDPFALEALTKKPGFGTKANPTLVPSATGQRLVGCMCNGEDSIAPLYLNLYEGRPQRCSCGHWYALKKIDFVE